MKIPVLISDVHGCIEELNELLNKIQYKPSQMRLIFLGDLCHRGPDSLACVRKAQELGAESVKGNHEDSLLRWRKHEANYQLTGKANPMKELSLVDKRANESMSEDDLKWIQSLPLKIDLGLNWHAIHAGVEPGVAFDKQVPAQMMRVRYVNEQGRGVSLNPDKTQPAGTQYWTTQWKGPQSIIYGHAVHSLEHPRSENFGDHSCVGIDTGCVFGGRLTGAFMHCGVRTLEGISPLYNEYKLELVQVQAKQKYCKIVGED